VIATPVGIRTTTPATLPWTITAPTLLAKALVMFVEASTESAVLGLRWPCSSKQSLPSVRRQEARRTSSLPAEGGN
jgi:hypothetical protein